MPARSEPYRPEAPIVAELAGGVVLFFETGDETLLLHERDEDRWCFPKGHVDPGESLPQAAIRETREETGITDVRLGEEIAEVSYRFYQPAKRRNVHKTTVYYLAFTRERSPRPEPTFDRAEWVSIATAGARVKYESDRRVVDAAAAARTRLRGPPARG